MFHGHCVCVLALLWLLKIASSLYLNTCRSKGWMEPTAIAKLSYTCNLKSAGASMGTCSNIRCISNCSVFSNVNLPILGALPK